MTVYERPNGKWAAQVYDPVTRRLRQVGTSVHTGDRGRREAFKLQAQAALRSQAGGGETVADFAARWIEEYPRPSQSTNLHYRERIRPFVEAFGRRRLNSITVAEAFRYARKHRSQLQAIRAMFSDARRSGLIETNPFTGLGIEQPRGRRDLPSEWLTAQDVDVLIDACSTVGSYAPFMRGIVTVAAYTGIRPGELYALEHSDVLRQTLLVRRSADSRTRTVKPHTKNGLRREVVLPEVAREAIQRAPRIAGTSLVFPAPRGGQLWASTFAWYWHTVRAGAGRPSMAFYELRHFCATHLLELGLSEADVALQLGHTDGGSLVREVYGHPSERAARARITAAVDGHHRGQLASARERRRVV